MKNAITEQLIKITGADNVSVNEDMSTHPTFKAGGKADIFVSPGNIKEAETVIRLLLTDNIPCTVIGNGSNLLVSDKGYQGVILKVHSALSSIRVEGEHVFAQAGATMAQVARVALEHGLTGLEFASGIPGTVGGGVVMNAGAYDGEMKQVVKNVEVLSSEGEVLTLDNETMEFGYRTSSIKGKPFVVTEVEFELRRGDCAQIKALMDDLAARRREKQPLEYPSAGSTFKRPEGHFAGKLIMDAGLRGYCVGGAQVSEKHCGFIINAQPGVTTASDVMTLIRYVQEVVKDQFDICLEPEVIFLGEF